MVRVVRSITLLLSLRILFSDCKCDIGGTTDSSIDCDETGQCQCKKYVTGLRCDACLGGFFGLNANNTDGNNNRICLL